MSTEITTAAELAGYPLGSTYIDRQGDVWMLDSIRPGAGLEVSLIGPETGRFDAAHVLRKWGPLTIWSRPDQPAQPVRIEISGKTYQHGPYDLWYPIHDGTVSTIGRPFYALVVAQRAQPTVQPSVEAVAEVLDIHRWQTMGVTSVQCECGEIVHGDSSLTAFPADKAFREHIAQAVLALIGGRAEAEAVKGVQRWMALDLHMALGHGVEPPADAEQDWADWWARMLAEVRERRTDAEIKAEALGVIAEYRDDLIEWCQGRDPEDRWDRGYLTAHRDVIESLGRRLTSAAAIRAGETGE